MALFQNVERRIHSQMDFFHCCTKLDAHSQIYSHGFALAQMLCAHTQTLCACESLLTLSLEPSSLLDLMLPEAFKH